MLIERLREEDIPALLQLYTQLVEGEMDGEAVRRDYREMTAREEYRVLVAKDGDRLVGTAMGICCMTLAFPGKRFLVIEDVVVDGSCRGQGVGKLLMEALDNFARESGCSYAILVSSGHRAGAHAFYRRMGYVEHVMGFRKGY